VKKLKQIHLTHTNQAGQLLKAIASQHPALTIEEEQRGTAATKQLNTYRPCTKNFANCEAFGKTAQGEP
jgi:hypothetical protein